MHAFIEQSQVKSDVCQKQADIEVTVRRPSTVRSQLAQYGRNEKQRREEKEGARLRVCHRLLDDC